MTESIIRFGIIGCGLMAREFASATQRWGHLLNMGVRPKLVAVADTKPSCLDWFTDNLCDITTAVSDYRDLLADPQVDALYCAVPHHLHAQIYSGAPNASPPARRTPGSSRYTAPSSRPNSPPNIRRHCVP